MTIDCQVVATGNGSGEPEKKYEGESMVSSTGSFITDALDSQLERVSKLQLLSENEVRDLCYRARDILVEEGNVLSLTAPITICGDIHGQFHDLLELFDVGGDFRTTKYLFLGDFVDRGFYSLETFIFLILLKVRYPNNIFLIRGNHECRQITQAYGFYDECIRKYNSAAVWFYCTELFDYLSLSALIDDKVFCVHGGLSPNLNNIDNIRAIDRKTEVPHEGVMCDLLWSDPEDIAGWNVSPRGAGYQFGADVVAKFNRANNVEFICRAHQLVNEGYRTHFDGTLVTIWSAPNYCYRCGNVASILKLDKNHEKSFAIFNTKTQLERLHPHRKSVPEYFL